MLCSTRATWNLFRTRDCLQQAMPQDLFTAVSEVKQKICRNNGKICPISEHDHMHTLSISKCDHPFFLNWLLRNATPMPPEVRKTPKVSFLRTIRPPPSRRNCQKENRQNDPLLCGWRTRDPVCRNLVPGNDKNCQNHKADMYAVSTCVCAYCCYPDRPSHRRGM